MQRCKYWAIAFIPLCWGISSANAADLAEMMPENTLLYAGWPGMNAFTESTKDTSFAKLMNEPEVLRFRETWREKLWPAVLEKMKEKMQEEGQIPPELFDATKDLLSAAWKYPTALGIANVSMDQEGPHVDAAIIIRADQESAHLAQLFDSLIELANKNGPGIEVKEVEFAGAKFKEFMPPGPPIPVRYGVLGDDFIFAIGKKLWEHLGATGAHASLAKSPRFAAAMKATGGSANAPVFYIDAQSIIATLETFQPLMAEIPVIGEEGGVKKVMEGLGLEKLESISMALVPEAGGFKTTCFINAPGLGEGFSKSFVQKPLSEDDLKSVPKDASWATVTNFDLVGFYDSVLSSIQKLSPETHAQATQAIAEGEKTAGLNIRNDVLGSFGDTWALFDAPSNGSLLFTGITLITEVTQTNKLESGLQSAIGLIGLFTGSSDSISIQHEEYRAQKIMYLNVKGLPIPIAPAWAEYEGKRVVALYPQMVRITLDRLMDKGESLLDNVDFQRARKLVPPNSSSISYIDTVAGMRTLYSIALPISQTLIAMGQGEGVPADPTLLPAWPTIARHLFGDISATAETKEGIITVSHGSMPLNVGNIMMGAVVGSSISASILMPALNRLRGVATPADQLTMPPDEAAHPANEASQELAMPATDLDNVTAIVKACLVYAENNKGKLPPDLKTLTKDEAGANVQLSQLKSSRDHTDAEVTYVYLSGQNSTYDPHNVVMYEDPDKVEGDDLAVGFMDGHVSTTNRKDLETLVVETMARMSELKQKSKKQK